MRALDSGASAVIPSIGAIHEFHPLTCQESAMRTVEIAGVGIVAMLLPNLSLGNSPAPLRYVYRGDNGIRPVPKAPTDKVVRVIENAPVSLTFHSDVKRPHMVIPQKYAVVDGKVGAKAEADVPSGRTALAGLTLSAAFVSGGFWLMRRNGRAGKAMLALFVISSTLFVSPLLSELSSNEAPPPKVPPKALDELKIDGTTANLGVDIVIVAEGERIEIVLPKQLLPVAMVPIEQFNGTR
jgi:hypothetical protein